MKNRAIACNYDWPYWLPTALASSYWSNICSQMHVATNKAFSIACVAI